MAACRYRTAARPEVLVLGLVVLLGLAVGALHGTVCATIGVPSFVVTLA